MKLIGKILTVFAIFQFTIAGAAFGQNKIDEYQSSFYEDIDENLVNAAFCWGLIADLGAGFKEDGIKENNGDLTSIGKKLIKRSDALHEDLIADYADKLEIERSVVFEAMNKIGDSDKYYELLEAMNDYEFIGAYALCVDSYAPNGFFTSDISLTKVFKYVDTVSLETCTTSIKEKMLHLDYNVNEDVIYEGDNTTFREIFLTGWGEIDCPAYITLREFTPELTDADRRPFCLNYDEEKGTYISISEGARDAYLVCKIPSKTYCERVNATKEEALALVGLGTATVAASAATTAALSSTGVAVVAHSSGAVILTGTGGYIAGTLGAAGTTVAAALTAPLTIAAGVITVVGVGGSVYLCK